MCLSVSLRFVALSCKAVHHNLSLCGLKHASYLRLCHLISLGRLPMTCITYLLVGTIFEVESTINLMDSLTLPSNVRTGQWARESREREKWNRQMGAVKGSVLHTEFDWS